MAQEEDREPMEGVELETIDEVLDSIEYPITADEIVERWGDEEVDRTNAEPISLRELFEAMGDTEFTSEQDFQEMLLAQMPRDSEGRTGYSDRGGSLPTETEEAEEAGESTSADFQEGESTDRDKDDQERHEAEGE